jgi:putative endonuclease
MKNFTSGLWAEKIAQIFLILKGYSILSTRLKNFKGTKYGEVDIIAKRGRALIFIEVKKRSTLDDALYAISQRQQKRIEESVSAFLKFNPTYQNMDIRFDAIIFNRYFRFKHLKDAWRS